MHFKKIIPFTILCLVVISCKNKKHKIEGKLNNRYSNLNGKKVYLYNYSFTPGLIIDSCIIQNSIFSFSLYDSILQNPFYGTIKFPDSLNNIDYYKPIGIENDFLSKTVMSFFYIDGSISFNYKTDSSKFATINYENKANNEPYFLQKEFLFCNEIDSLRRKNLLIKDEELITKYQNSFYLLNKLLLTKNKIKEEEAKMLLSKFSDQLQSSTLAQAINKYYLHITKYSANYNYALLNQLGNLENFIVKDKEKQVIIFWASWCLPCRKEIPLLKSIYKKLDTAKTSLTSISLDTEDKNWLNALKNEKMPWKQLRCSTNDMLLEMSAIFDIATIPKIYLRTKDSLLKINTIQDLQSKLLE